MKNLDPINDPENEDMSEVEICRHCTKPIRPGAEIRWNGWCWHVYCVPLSALLELGEQNER